MKPQTIGRVLGVGLRVAGRMAGQRIAGSAPAAATRAVTVDGLRGTSSGRATGRTAGRATGSLTRGIGGFLRPFRRIGNILFLEVVGVFFLIFVLVFGQMAWRTRASCMHGADHLRFVVATAVMLLFLYLTVSSFWRARRK